MVESVETVCLNSCGEVTQKQTGCPLNTKHDRLLHRCHNKLTLFKRKETSYVLYIMLNLQEGTSDSKFVEAV